jgi:diguanylate cyclase (GGDEF)-like protein/PAS domain S-box-containing protein
MELQRPEAPAETSATVRPGSWDMSNAQQLFYRCLVDSLREGVVMMDRFLKITTWSRAAEGMTGLRATAMLNQRWLPSLIDLRDRFDKPVPDKLCPVMECLRRGEQVKVAATVTGHGGRQIALELQAIPVVAHDRSIHGAVVIFNDLSSQLDLEQQVMSLYAHATRDQLTGLSNRAHFERSMEARIREFQTKGTICSLIVADIDFFKKINDDFGHHVGDQALISFARVLQQGIRVHDLVARYGGEEFVIVCPDCPVDAAADRAEKIREALANQPITVLGGRCITASFGVTEFQQDDSAISAFVRADQALLMAKDAGRNQVKVIADTDKPEQIRENEIEKNAPKKEWKSLRGIVLRSIEGETNVPVDVMVEKVKGYVSDNNADVIFAEPNHVRLRIRKPAVVKLRRAFDRHTPLFIDLESRPKIDLRTKLEKGTELKISVRVVHARDRRHREIAERVALVLRDFVEHLGIASSFAEKDEETR